MVDPKDYLELEMKFHGHKCPAMPMGLCVGAAAYFLAKSRKMVV